MTGVHVVIYMGGTGIEMEKMKLVHLLQIGVDNRQNGTSTEAKHDTLPAAGAVCGMFFLSARLIIAIAFESAIE